MRRNFLIWTLSLFLTVLFVACGGSGGAADDGGNSAVDAGRLDTARDSQAGRDVPTALDSTGEDTVEQDAADGTSEPPGPEFVHAIREHAACIPDEPFLADRATWYGEEDGLPAGDLRTAVAEGGRVWVGAASGLYAAGLSGGEDDRFERVDLGGATGAVAHITPSVGGGVLAASGTHVVLVDGAGVVSDLGDLGAAVGEVAVCGGEPWAIAGGVFRLSADGPPVEDAGAPAVPLGLTCVDGEPWLGGADGLFRRAGGDWQMVWAPADGVVQAVAGVNWGDGGRAVVSTRDAVVLIGADGAETTLRAGPGELPLLDVRGLAGRGQADRAGEWAVAHGTGVSRVQGDGAEGAGVEHFFSQRWLPSDEVHAVAFDDAGDLWVATADGVARLWREETTLAARADGMLAQLERWFWRMDGFISAHARFAGPWSEEAKALQDDDNDGQWTEEGVAAFCYAFAATGEERYRTAARRAVRNMMMLIDVPAVDFEAAGMGRGFVARSLVRDDEGAVFDAKATLPNWHRVDYHDGHTYYWKDDTSSDETTGHFFGLGVFHDLCAEDEDERAEVAGYITTLAGRILDDGFRLIDLDGERTEHGHWDPETLAVAVDGVDDCFQEGGYPLDLCFRAYMGNGYLNGTEILGAMLAAWHVSGEQRFLDAYEELITVHRYNEVVTFHDQIMTWVNPALRNLCDHELADLAHLTLLRYEPNPERREIWRRAVVDSFPYERGERNPLKALVFAATFEDDHPALADGLPGLAAGVRTLREYPDDLRKWGVDSSHRLDYERDVNDRHGTAQYTAAPPYDEIQVMRWDYNPYAVTAHGDGASRISPAFWLLPYWGLRYHGGICR